MSRKQLTGVIEGNQEIKIGEQVLFAVDFKERNAQAFTISGATIEMFDSTGASVISVDTATVTVGLAGSVRVQHLLTAAETGALTEGQYTALWELTLADSQTRKIRQSVDVVAA